MNDRTPEQINNSLDRTESILSDLAVRQAALEAQIGTMAGAVEQLALSTNRRLQQHDLELDDHDVRVEVQERLHTALGDRMDKIDTLLAEMREDRKTTLQILQIMTARFAGEPPQDPA